jgi:ribose-phosphate pyrophosphokinase
LQGRISFIYHRLARYFKKTTFQANDGEAVMPYFPYSRQSKKKSHRGAITARMIANLLTIAGVDHVITIDLHASQMQGFFKCPVDNLVAEPLLARWIKRNITEWKEAVVVSKNAGGTKRVTSLADVLKINFGIVTTDRHRPRQQDHDFGMNESIVFEKLTKYKVSGEPEEMQVGIKEEDEGLDEASSLTPVPSSDKNSPGSPRPSVSRRRTTSNSYRSHREQHSTEPPSSPLAKSALPGGSPDMPALDALVHTQTAPAAPPSFEEREAEEFHDERARDVIQGRLIQGHIVDEDFPSPAFSAGSSSTQTHHQHRTRGQSGTGGTAGTASDQDDSQHDPMTASFLSTVSSMKQEKHEHTALGGSHDAGASSEEEEEDLRNPELETTVTLVGNVRDRTVFVVDDMIDKAGSWIAAAETVSKRGGASRVYCMATHGLFGGNSLRELQDCDYIDGIVVTNTFPIEEARKAGMDKLVILDVAPLLSEAIRRNHHGESISQLFMHYD